jgi:hypothetical protein
LTDVDRERLQSSVEIQKFVAASSGFSVRVERGRMVRSQNAAHRGASLDLARVLVVHRELPARLALQTILRASGYAVDVAANAQEALTKLDEGEYELVLGHQQSGGRDVLAYARIKAYRPATALITGSLPVRRSRDQVSVHTEDLPHLLGKVAELIGLRATRRYSRAMRVAG